MAPLNFNETKEAASKCLREAVTKPIDEAKEHVDQQLLSKLVFRQEEHDAADPALVDQQKAVEMALSLMLEELCDVAESKGVSVQDVGVNTFLDLSMFIASEGSSDKSIPFMLLESLFESQTITGCQRAFEYIETRSAELLEPSFIKRGKLTVLRMCNEVLRRLSKSTNAAFAGRVLIFLAGAFPLSERSAVNVKSLNNVANTTIYEEEPTDNFSSNDQEMEVETDQSKVICSDANFYKMFWSLQAFFAQPTKLFDPQAFTAFQTNSSTILDAFEAYWISSVAASATVSSGEDDFYFPKFLTNSNLMNLQLDDAYFCRHILVQFLILVQSVINHQSRLPPMQTLKEPQKKMLCALETRVFELIGKIGGKQGTQFSAAVKAMLHRELAWMNWKREGCTPYERKPPVVSEAQDDAAEQTRKRKPFPIKDVWGQHKRGKLGQHALSALWQNNGDSMEELAAEKQDFAPSMKDIVEPVIEELDPDQGIEEQYRSKNTMLYTWRALRVISKHCLDKCDSRYFGKQKDGTQNIDAIAKILAPDLEIEMSSALKAFLYPPVESK